MPSLKYSRDNIENIRKYSNIVDHTFVTTATSELKKYANDINNSHFFFVPVDKNIELFDVYKLRPQKDLFYAMSHGVNRATLKEGTEDERIIFLNKFSSIKLSSLGSSNLLTGQKEQPPLHLLKVSIDILSNKGRRDFVSFFTILFTFSFHTYLTRNLFLRFLIGSNIPIFINPFLTNLLKVLVL